MFKCKKTIMPNRKHVKRKSLGKIEQRSGSLAAAERERLRAIANRDGLEQAAERAGMDSRTLSRVIAGLHVHPGSIALAERLLEAEAA